MRRHPRPHLDEGAQRAERELSEAQLRVRARRIETAGQQEVPPGSVHLAEVLHGLSVDHVAGSVTVLEGQRASEGLHRFRGSRLRQQALPLEVGPVEHLGLEQLGTPVALGGLEEPVVNVVAVSERAPGRGGLRIASNHVARVHHRRDDRRLGAREVGDGNVRRRAAAGARAQHQ